MAGGLPRLSSFRACLHTVRLRTRRYPMSRHWHCASLLTGSTTRKPGASFWTFPSRPRERRAHLPQVVVPLATVEVARAHAAALESASRSRTGRGRSDRASQPVPCRRARPGGRAEPSSRTGIPLLRLPNGSKGGEVLEFAVAHRVGPPLYCLATRPGWGS